MNVSRQAFRSVVQEEATESVEEIDQISYLH
jgi:hypothetical protein